MRSSLLLLLATSTALAGEFSETLSKAERRQIEDAIVASLPPVDKAAVKKCAPMLEEYNKDPEHNVEQLFGAARCYRTAGALGASIQYFRLYQKYGKDDAKKKEMLRTLADAYEAAANFYEAASSGEEYAKMYPRETDARDRMIRATCIRRQLGQGLEARNDAMYLQRLFRTKADDTLCATIRPIAMPAKKS